MTAPEGSNGSGKTNKKLSTPRTSLYDERLKKNGGVRSSTAYTKASVDAIEGLKKLGYGRDRNAIVGKALEEAWERLNPRSKAVKKN